MLHVARRGYVKLHLALLTMSKDDIANMNTSKIDKSVSIVELNALARNGASMDGIASDMLAMTMDAPIIIRYDVPAIESATMAKYASIVASKDAIYSDSIKARALAALNKTWLDLVCDTTRKDGVQYVSHSYASKANLVMRKNGATFQNTRISVKPSVGEICATLANFGASKTAYKAWIVIQLVKGAPNMKGRANASVSITSDGVASLDAELDALATNSATKVDAPIVNAFGTNVANDATSKKKVA